MLTIATLKGNDKLKDLSDDILAVIEQMSKADEDTVIGTRVSEIHGRYDEDIKALTGVDKPANTKTYDYLRQAVQPIVEKANNAKDTSALEKQIGELQTTNKQLQKQIEEGATDPALKSQLESLQTRLKDKEDELATIIKDKEALAQDLAGERQKATHLGIMQRFSDYEATEGFVYNKALKKETLDDILQTRRERLLGRIVPDTVKGQDGKEIQVFRDPETKEILRNSGNAHKPFTAGELWEREVADLLEKERKVPGGGTNIPGGGGGATGSVDLTGVKNKFEAVDRITDHLIKNEGLTKLDPKFDVRQQELFAELKVEETFAEPQ